jgi:hypothetical protein
MKHIHACWHYLSRLALLACACVVTPALAQNCDQTREQAAEALSQRYTLDPPKSLLSRDCPIGQLVASGGGVVGKWINDTVNGFLQSQCASATSKATASAQLPPQGMSSTPMATEISAQPVPPKMASTGQIADLNRQILEEAATPEGAIAYQELGVPQNIGTPRPPDGAARRAADQVMRAQQAKSTGAATPPRAADGSVDWEAYYGGRAQ